MIEFLLGLLVVVILLLIYYYSLDRYAIAPTCTKRRNVCGKKTDIYGSGTMSYDDYVKDKSLETSTFASHNEYINDLKSSPNAANHVETILEEVDVNPWVGLRRPEYQKISMGTDARTVPSYIYGQTPRYTSISNFV